MMITPRDTAVLASVAHYYTLTRPQITRLHFQDDADGRITRKRLQVLLGAHLLNRTRMEVVNPAMGAPAPVYYPSERGCAYLAQEREDPRYLTVCTATPSWTNLYHFVAIAETHILLDQAVAGEPGVRVADWLGEWSVANPEESAPEKRYRLYTLLSEPGQPRLVAAPDAAFLLEKDDFRKVFYLEQDRDSTKNAQRVASQKARGYAALFDRRLHTRHFPTANVEKFTVLMVAPTLKRVHALRQAFASHAGSQLYKFASLSELTPETFLTAPIWFPCSGDPAPLLLPPRGGEQ